MCPLGGGLSIFGRVRMFNWLKRHPECGTRTRAFLAAHLGGRSPGETTAK
jgi:hypothetical protein